MSGRRVLLIEDDAELADALRDVLDDRGHVVMAARDGVEGLRRMREFRPDIIVLDLMMPRLDGWQFRVEQRGDPGMAATPVIVISASASPVASAVDADLYLHKPIDADTLVNAVEGVLMMRERRSERASRAQTARLAAVGTLAAGLAHEINNPLTYVLLQLSRARKLLAADHDAAEVDALVASALDGAERIRGVTQAIRAFTDRDAIDDSPLGVVDVRSAVAAAIALAGNVFRDRGRLTTRFDGPCLVTANEGQLAQVVLNLVVNAAQAIPIGAADHHAVGVAVATRGDRVRIDVSDTGCGIAPALVGRIFEPFFTTKPVGEGTGLGLSISYGIVASFGGTIDVTSALGRGTTVTVALPAATKESAWTTAYRS